MFNIQSLARVALIVIIIATGWTIAKIFDELISRRKLRNHNNPKTISKKDVPNVTAKSKEDGNDCTPVILDMLYTARTGYWKVLSKPNTTCSEVLQGFKECMRPLLNQKGKELFKQDFDILSEIYQRLDAAVNKGILLDDNLQETTIEEVLDFTSSMPFEEYLNQYKHISEVDILTDTKILIVSEFLKQFMERCTVVAK